MPTKTAVKSSSAFSMQVRRRFLQSANSAEAAAIQLERLALFGDSADAGECDKLAAILRKASTFAMRALIARETRRPATTATRRKAKSPA